MSLHKFSVPWLAAALFGVSAVASAGPDAAGSATRRPGRWHPIRVQLRPERWLT